MRDDPLTKKADELARSVYKITRGFPPEEIYGITSQLRRAILSVPLNIIEGFARRGSRDYRQFLYISYASLKEAKYLLYFAHNEGYLIKRDYEEAILLAEEVGKMIWASLKTIEKRLDKK